jgi:glycosyltransferase involved in cell wall biosynthesis
MSMRMLFVCPDMRTGGAERHWATLIPALKRRGVDARVLCLAEEGALFGELAAAGVPAECIRMRGRADPRAWRRALSLARPRPDAVVSRGVSALLVGEAIALRSRAPHVVNEHTPLTPAGELLPLRPHQRPLTRLVAPRVRLVIAVTARQVEPLTRLGYRRDRIVVVPNGVFSGALRPAAEREPARQSLGLEDGDFAVLCVANLRPEKGVDVFIRSVAEARRSQPRIRGLVAGEGRERERLAALADGAGVELLGVRDDIPDLMLAADAVALTSEAEALPMSVLEAMALGRPLVAADVGGILEAVADGETGLVVPAGDAAGAGRALVTLAANPEYAAGLGAAARERQRERFDGEAMVDGYLRALERVAAASAEPRSWSSGGRASPASAEPRRVSPDARPDTPDILLVSLGTTLGWRVADRLFLEQLERAGASAAAVSVRFGLAGRLRRGYPANDLVEMVAARRALRAALDRDRPRAVVFSSTTAAMLAPRLELPFAVRLDAPARINRPGTRNAVLHALERRALARARLTLPWSRAAREALPAGSAPAVVVPPPVEPSGEPADEREWLAVAYVPDPKAKGLDVLVAGWSAAAVEGARLAVYGIDPEWARRHLERTGVAEAPSVEWPGMVPGAEFRAATRRARVFAAGARWEDFGQAPLEALADGALLATVPSGGPFEALRIARTLEPSLVAARLEPAALGRAIRAAFELPDERARDYRRRARELLRPFRAEAVEETIAREVLPALLE